MTLAGFLVAPLAAPEWSEREVRSVHHERTSGRGEEWDADAHQHALAEQVRRADADAARAAFDQLYETHFVPLWRLARQFTRSDMVAKDVVQDVFVAVWTHRTEWSVDGSVRGYLYRAVRNRALNANRDDARHHADESAHVDVDHSRLRSGNSAKSASIEDVADTLAQSPDTGVEVRALEVALQVAVDALPERQRTALLLFWHESMNMSEIARVLGITPASSRKLLMNAQDKLRRAVAAYL